MDHIYYNDTHDVYCDVKDSAEETYEPPPQPIPASLMEVPKSKSIPSPQTFDISDQNRKQRSQRKSFSRTQVVLIVAVTIFATLSSVFMAMYFTHEGKSKHCDGQKTSRNDIEEKYKPCVFQNGSLVTNSSQSKNDSKENGQCPVGCVNSTILLISTGCAELYKKGEKLDGVYTIDPDGFGAFTVSCDMTTDGGGWTVFQKRVDGSVDFYRNWKNYTEGFGTLCNGFWLGLDKIHRLTVGGQNILRIDMEDFENETRYAKYKNFRVLNETDKYKLNIGQYSGDAGNSLGFHNGMNFSTKDMDNDQHKQGSCAQWYKGAWWYSDCHFSCLNGQYLRGNHALAGNGIIWGSWKGNKYSLKKTEMKIRPRSF